MPTIPKTTEKTVRDLNMQQVVNTIRANASDFYRQQTIAVMNQDDLHKLYAIFETYDSLKTEFMGLLFSRIAKVFITSALFRNPLAFLKKGEVELGEIIEEAFVAPAKPHVYDDANVEDQAALRREEGEIHNTFYIMNYKTFYKVTIFNTDLRKYFLSWDGVEDLIAKMTESLYNGAYRDEFLVMKYMVGQQIINGNITTLDVGNFEADPTGATTAIKTLSNLMTFPSTDYNMGGVDTFTNRADQFFIVSSKYDAIQSVEVQAAAFNLGKVEFEGQRVLVDSFGRLDIERLKQLNKLNPYFVPPTPQQLAELDNIAGVIIDRNWFQIYDNLNKTTEIYNPEKLFWNYFLHVWRTFASSPFANAVALVNGKPNVELVTVSPSAASIAAGEGIALTAKVTGTGFFSQGVTWSTDNTEVTVNSEGYLKASRMAKPSTVTVTATSKADPTVSGTATVTVTA